MAESEKNLHDFDEQQNLIMAEVESELSQSTRDFSKARISTASQLAIEFNEKKRATFLSGEKLKEELKGLEYEINSNSRSLRHAEEKLADLSAALLEDKHSHLQSLDSKWEEADRKVDAMRDKYIKLKTALESKTTHLISQNLETRKAEEDLLKTQRSLEQEMETNIEATKNSLRVELDYMLDELVKLEVDFLAEAGEEEHYFRWCFERRKEIAQPLYNKLRSSSDVMRASHRQSQNLTSFHVIVAKTCKNCKDNNVSCVSVATQTVPEDFQR